MLRAASLVCMRVVIAMLRRLVAQSTVWSKPQWSSTTSPLPQQRPRGPRQPRYPDLLQGQGGGGTT